MQTCCRNKQEDCKNGGEEIHNRDLTKETP